MKSSNSCKMLIAATMLLSAMFLNSCGKTMQEKSAPVHDKAIEDAILAVTPIAQWNFDSSWREGEQNLVGVAHYNARFSSTTKAHLSEAAFLTHDSGFVSYNNAGTALPNLTTGLTVDFWVYASAKEGGAQCIWCLPQTIDQNGQPAFWPNHHVLLDAYSLAKGDTGLIKIMFKVNKNIAYNERWTEVGNIPNFYRRWSHIQYAYNGSTSKLTVKVNGHTYVNHRLQYTDGTNTTLVGNLVANPGSHGIVIGDFQNTWDPGLFGAAQPWMLRFKGRIDDLKVYDTALF